MGNVFYLEEDIVFPEIYGIISELPPWKMCYIVSAAAGVELAHEDATGGTPNPAGIIHKSQRYSFEKYVWQDEEEEQFIQLIQNKTKIKPTVEHKLPANDLFGEIPDSAKTLFLLEEWKQADYIVHTEGLEQFFNPMELKNKNGIRLVLHATADHFKNYDKII